MTDRRAPRASRLMVVSAGVLVLAAAFVAWRSGHSSAASVPSRSAVAHRVKVEVLNSGKVVGAARTGALLLRHAGLDVMYYGDAGAALAGREHSQVLVRRGDTTGVGRVVETLGHAEVVEAPDPSRLVELTVLLGKDFVPSSGIRP